MHKEDPPAHPPPVATGRQDTLSASKENESHQRAREWAENYWEADLTPETYRGQKNPSYVRVFRA